MADPPIEAGEAGEADEADGPLAREAPALFRALSPLGRRVAAARGNGPARARTAAPAAAVADEESRQAPGRAAAGASTVALPGLAAALAGLSAEDFAHAAAASPAAGLPELRERWRDWQRRNAPPRAPSSLPLVTAGLSHALSLAAELFGGPGRAVAIPEPFWGNYRDAFEMRTQARVLAAPAYVGGRFNPHAIAAALAGLPAGEPAVALLNLPSNPGGYSPTAEERRQLRGSLLEVAERRPLIVICDDAYAGLVYEAEVPRGSMFWELAGAHPDLVAVKVDGATKEFSFFGGRVGFLTFAVEPGSGAARALEAKLEVLVRSAVGTAAASQVVLLAALRRPGIEREVEAVRALLAGRYRALRQALASADPCLVSVLPFNSGCFALVELPAALGLTADAVRRHLLAHHDTGVISIAPRYLRLAHCSVAAAALPELVRRLERAIAELAGRAP